MSIRKFMLAATVGALLGTSGPALAQNGEVTIAGAVAPVPFGVGEKMTYRARFGIFGTVGEGSLSVEDIDTVHGHPTYRLAFRLRGGVAFWRMDDTTYSWLDVGQLYARRFEQNLNQTRYQRHRILDFYPETMRWDRQNSDEEGELATPEPLDDVSFLYFVRMLPLTVGETYTLPRYFRADGNPVTVRVLRKERVRTPAGEFDTIVVRPIIRTRGLFSEGGEAEVWLTDDASRTLVRLRARVSSIAGTLTMEMTDYVPGRPLKQRLVPAQ